MMLAKAIHHTVFKTEYDQRKTLRPRLVQDIRRVRRKCYVYWEISRLSRGLPKTFTYSSWDSNAQCIYHNDIQGQILFEKINLHEERLDLINNPLLGPFFRRKKEVAGNPRQIRKLNKIAAYYFNANKYWDLDNYLHSKPLSVYDLICYFWYQLAMKSGYADPYRNEQFVVKPDFQYEYETRLHAMNFDQPRVEAVATNLMLCTAQDLANLEKKWSNVTDNEEEED